MLQEVRPQTTTPARGREMIDFVRASFRWSIRRACRTVPACQATYHYRSRRPEQAPLIQRIREIAETRMRYGCKKLAAETSGCGGRIVRIWRPCRNDDQNRPCLRRLECALAGALGYTGLQLRFFCPG